MTDKPAAYDEAVGILALRHHERRGGLTCGDIGIECASCRQMAERDLDALLERWPLMLEEWEAEHYAWWSDEFEMVYVDGEEVPTDAVKLYRRKPTAPTEASQ